MGLFDFMKKKEENAPVVQTADNFLNTDLPSIDGSNMSPVPEQPQFSDNSPKSVSINVPTLDFSLPPLDDQQRAPVQNPDSALSEEDLKRLFPSDDWKEPDWNTFSPYPEEKIDEPKPEDFSQPAGSDLPSFDDEYRSVNSPQESTEIKRAGPRPVELYIRGKAYNRVFAELETINQTLSRQDSKTSSYDELMRQEELLFNQAKEQTEYLYKKFGLVDRKIFTG